MGWNDIKAQANGDMNNGGGSKKVEYLKIAPGGTVVIKLLDSEPKSAWRHWIPAGRRSVVCSGERDCPVCMAIKGAKNAGMKSPYNSSFKHTINVLVIKPNGVHEVWLFEQGITVFESFLQQKETVEALGQDFNNFCLKVTRTGSGQKDTKYNVSPVPNPEGLDVTQYESQMYDLEQLKPLSNEDVEKLMKGEQLGQAQEETPTNAGSEQIKF